MSRHLPYLKIQSSRGRDLSDFFCSFFKTSSEDVKDVRFAFPEVLSELTYSSRADWGAVVNGFLEGLAWVWVVLI